MIDNNFRVFFCEKSVAEINNLTIFQDIVNRANIEPKRVFSEIIFHFRYNVCIGI